MILGSRRLDHAIPILPDVLVIALRTFETYLKAWEEKEEKTLSDERREMWNSDCQKLTDEGILEQFRTRRIWGWDDYPFEDSKKESYANLWNTLLLLTISFDSTMTRVCGICGKKINRGGADGESGLCYYCWK